MIMKKILIILFTIIFYNNLILSSTINKSNLSLTIYKDFALIRDNRTTFFQKGKNVVIFKNISPMIRPASITLLPERVQLIEYKFNYEPLTPQSLLKRFVGKYVKVVKYNKATQEEKIVKAKILSVINGIILEINNHIETGVPLKDIIFPNDLKTIDNTPNLTMLVNTNNSGKQNIELIYLTDGISWKADYIAELNNDETNLKLKCYITLKNRSGTSYNNSKIQLIAGDINKVSIIKKKNYLMKAAFSAKPENMKQESLFEYHLYFLPYLINLKNNEDKHVLFFSGKNLKCKKEFLIKDTLNDFRENYGNFKKKLKVLTFIKTENSTNIPLPKGIIQVYKKDLNGVIHFIGENRISHTPKNANINLKLGNSFDITAFKVQTDFKREYIKNRTVIECSYNIEIKNHKDIPVKIKVREPISGNWKILEESHAHKKVSSNIVEWLIPIDKKGISILKYRIMIEY